MKIILDLPDTTCCAILNYICRQGDLSDRGLEMTAESIAVSELQEGAVIKIHAPKPKEDIEYVS